MRAPPFWPIWSSSGERPPQRRHASERDAETEARRLAQANPGTEFYVLQPTVAITVRTISVERFSTDDVPF